DLDRRCVGVKERLESDHFVAWVDEREHRRRERLGGTRRDHNFRFGVVVQPIRPAAVRGDGLPQRQDAASGRVLVDAAGNCRPRLFEHERRAIGVGEALPQVDRLRCQGERRHLGENRGGRRADSVGFPGRGHTVTLVPPKVGRPSPSVRLDWTTVSLEPGGYRWWTQRKRRCWIRYRTDCSSVVNGLRPYPVPRWRCTT